MEWLGILLLYAISGYMKKRNKDAKNREIELDPDWDGQEDTVPKRPQVGLDQMFSDLFGQPLKVESEVPPVPEHVKEVSEPEVYKAPAHVESHSSNVKDRAELFEKNIHHSKLGKRSELRVGKKGRKKKRFLFELFDSKKSMKKAIILKEVLDKPLTMR